MDDEFGEERLRPIPVIILFRDKAPHSSSSVRGHLTHTCSFSLSLFIFVLPATRVGTGAPPYPFYLLRDAMLSRERWGPNKNGLSFFRPTDLTLPSAFARFRKPRPLELISGQFSLCLPQERETLSAESLLQLHTHSTKNTFL